MIHHNDDNNGANRPEKPNMGKALISHPAQPQLIDLYFTPKSDKVELLNEYCRNKGLLLLIIVNIPETYIDAFIQFMDDNRILEEKRCFRINGGIEMECNVIKKFRHGWY